MQIESVFPSDDSQGVPVGVEIFVIFDQEVDETTLDRAFIMTGPDQDRWTGPDLQIFDRPTTEDPDYFLDSPDYTGIVQGTFTVTKLDATGAEVDDETYGYGVPAHYKSKVTFTPNDVLSPSTNYTITVSGDELDTDDIKAGIVTRTVFDTQLGANTGSGTATLTGGYDGVIDDTFVIEITADGNIGTATYRWYRTSDPLTIRTGTTSANEKLLDDHVYVTFGGSAFDDGDIFRVAVKAPAYMSGSYTWDFTTGSGAIQDVPATTSTSVLGDVGAISVDTTPFEVVETTPAHLASQVTLDTNLITIDFTDSLDEDTVTQETVKVYLHPVLGGYTGNSVEDIGEIPKILSVSGSRLTIKI